MLPLTLIPLDATHHAGLLQAVYASVPAYWQLVGLDGPDPHQAAHDLEEAGETAGRTLLGVLLPSERMGEDARAEMIGMLDLRLHFPEERVASLGLMLVAEPYQRQGVGQAAWALLEPWLAQSAGMERVRLRVEQQNHAGLRFFAALGFAMTGEATRIRMGDKFVRLLAMEKELRHQSPPA